MANTEYARVEDGIVVERLTLDSAIDLAATFSAEFRASLKECSSAVGIGWEFVRDKFEAPKEETPTLDAVKAQRIGVLRSACEAQIMSGFSSDALGGPHSYPSDIKAQINLMGSVTDSLMPDLPANWSTPFWVCDEAGSWKWEMHNATQIQQAGRDGKANVVRNQAKLDELTSAVAAAKTKKAVEAVTW